MSRDANTLFDHDRCLTPRRHHPGASLKPIRYDSDEMQIHSLSWLLIIGMDREIACCKAMP